MVERVLIRSACCLLILQLLLTSEVKAQATFDSAYWKVVMTRADKIVKTLSVKDETQYTKVQQRIALQYYQLNELLDSAEAQIKQVKASAKEDKNTDIKELEQARDEKLEGLHQQYLADLSQLLSTEQIDQVKNGMTYNVLPNTYHGYLEMLPTLTQHQKDTIMLYLVEAREHAMDAGSSDKKHWWFGKYKGRINNYLSAQGYDLKKAGDDWERRRNASKNSTSAK